MARRPKYELPIGAVQPRRPVPKGYVAIPFTAFFELPNGGIIMAPLVVAVNRKGRAMQNERKEKIDFECGK